VVLAAVVTSTFEGYAERLEASRLVLEGAATSDAVATAIGELDAAVAGVEGHGFEPTPFAPAPELAAITLGVARAVKPAPVSTGNTSGRHVLRRSARAGPAMMAP